MNKARKKHNEAMELVAKADMALWKAARLEAGAARLVDIGSEPTRSVLYRSAATLNAQAGFLNKAVTLIAEAREGNVPPEIEEELCQVEELIAVYRKIRG